MELEGGKISGNRIRLQWILLYLKKGGDCLRPIKQAFIIPFQCKQGRPGRMLDRCLANEYDVKGFFG